MSKIKNASEFVDQSASELQQYNNASMKVIKDLQTKVSKLEAENESLKTMLEQNVPAIQNFKDLGIGISNEQIICLTQLSILKEAAIIRSLTMEEVKKVEILTKVLSGINSKPGEDEESARVKALSPEELIKLVKSDVAN